MPASGHVGTPLTRIVAPEEKGSNHNRSGEITTGRFRSQPSRTRGTGEITTTLEPLKGSVRGSESL
eukprot:8830664-Pyramimonas_sp.AAC.1